MLKEEDENALNNLFLVYADQNSKQDPFDSDEMVLLLFEGYVRALDPKPTRQDLIDWMQKPINMDGMQHASPLHITINKKWPKMFRRLFGSSSYEYWESNNIPGHNLIEIYQLICVNAIAYSVITTQKGREIFMKEVLETHPAIKKFNAQAPAYLFTPQFNCVPMNNKHTDPSTKPTKSHPENGSATNMLRYI